MAARLVILFLLILAGAAAAGAEDLQRLHVRSFTLSSDTQHPRVNVPFDVTLTIRVSENVRELKNVYLPSFFGPEELGDEWQLHHDRNGTVYRETMRLVARSAGPLSIGSAYLDAVDARDGKPKRFISGGLQLSVTGVPGASAAGRIAAWSIAALLVAAAALIALFLALGMRAARPEPAAPQPLPAPDPPSAAPPDPVEQACSHLRRVRDRRAVMQLREAFWRRAGAREGETLQDVLARTHSNGERSHRMLILLERAAFVEESALQAAIDGVLAASEETTA